MAGIQRKLGDSIAGDPSAAVTAKKFE